MVEVLFGDRREGALGVVHAIAEALPIDSTPDVADRAGLCGAAGFAVFYAYLAELTGQERHADIAGHFANIAIAGAEEPSFVAATGHSLVAGLVGIGWAMEHLRGRLWEEDEDLNGSVDDAVRTILSGGARSVRRYELFYGLTGYGVYALERFAHGGSIELCELVLSALEARAETTPLGTTWRTPRELVFERDRAQFPDGLYDLGLAHGVTGVIGLLTSLYPLPGLRERVEPLLRGAVRWLRAQRVTNRFKGHYPALVGLTGVAERAARSGWCYGDVGIALTLLRAGSILGDEALRTEAIELALSRPDELFDVEDAGLCHGAAGVALLFARMARLAPEADGLVLAAQRWANTTITLRRPGTGIAGYSALDVDGWSATPNLLTGAAGIGLALLALATGQAPAWDRWLLMSGIDVA
jgi:lantibiotic modifying enzyme